MNKSLATILFSALLLTACGNKVETTEQTWEILPADDATYWPVVKMNSVLSSNLYFKMRFDTKAWEIINTKGEQLTNLAFRNLNYSENQCLLLPGTKGYKLEKQYEIGQWAYKSDRTYGIDFEFKNPVTGIIEMRVFEAQSNGEGFPSVLFELHLPLDGSDQTQCYEDYKQLIGTYSFDHFEGNKAELDALLQNLAEIQKINEENEKKQELEELKSTSTGTVSSTS